MNAMTARLQPKNQKYYVLDSEVTGLRIYVQLTGENFFIFNVTLKSLNIPRRQK
tara:strand:- start:1202 stop:1363 length:162 start_codon:yes stop_codon:yes gene_type:complete